MLERVVATIPGPSQGGVFPRRVYWAGQRLTLVVLAYMARLRRSNTFMSDTPQSAEAFVTNIAAKLLYPRQWENQWMRRSQPQPHTWLLTVSVWTRYFQKLQPNTCLQVIVSFWTPQSQLHNLGKTFPPISISGFETTESESSKISYQRTVGFCSVIFISDNHSKIRWH